MAPKIIATSLFTLALVACTRAEPRPETPAPFAIRVEARTEGKTPLADVELWNGGQRLGHTNAHGELALALEGDEGERLTLEVRCPQGFASPERPLLVGLRHLRAGSPPPKFQVDCVRLVHSVLVGIWADNGPHLPILHLKQKVGETDERGVAHVLLSAQNDERVSLTLDTSASRGLHPQNPSLSFVTRDHDEFVLLENKFALERPAPVRTVRRRGPQPL